jgi:serine/threonine protein kinase
VKVWVAELVVALTQLHSKGLLVRSIKPEDLALDEDGHVYLTDLNLYKIIGRGRATSFVCVPPSFLFHFLALLHGSWMLSTDLNKFVQRNSGVSAAGNTTRGGVWLRG